MKRFPWLILAAGIVLTLGLSACSTGSSGSGGSGDTGDTGGTGGSISSANAAVANMPELEADLPCSLGGDGENCANSSASTTQLASANMRRTLVDEDFPQATVSVVDFDLVSDVRSSSWLEFRERAGMPEPYGTFVEVLRGLAEEELLVEDTVITVPAFDLNVGGPPGSGSGDEEGTSEPLIQPTQSEQPGGKARVVSLDGGYRIYWLLPLDFGDGEPTNVYMQWDILVDENSEWLITAQAQIEMASDSIIDPAFTFGAWAQFDTAEESMVIVEAGTEYYGVFTSVSRSYKVGDDTIFISSEEFLSDQYEDDYWTVFGWGNDNYGGLANISERQSERFIYQDFYDANGSLILEQFGQEWTQDVINQMFCDLDEAIECEYASFAPTLPEGVTILEITDSICDFASNVAVSDTDYANFYVVETWNQETDQLDRRLICGFDMTENGSSAYEAGTHKSLASIEFTEPSYEPTPVSPSDADVPVGFFWDAYYKGYPNTNDEPAPNDWNPGDGRFVTTSWEGPVTISFTSGGQTWSDAWMQEYTIMQRVEEPQQLYSTRQYLLNSHYPLKRITPSSVDVWRSCNSNEFDGETYTWCEYFFENNEPNQAGYGEFNWSSEDEAGIIADTRLDRVFDWTYYTWNSATETESFVTAPFLSTTLPTPNAPFVEPSQVDSIFAGMQEAYTAASTLDLSQYLENLTDALSTDANFEGLAD